MALAMQKDDMKYQVADTLLRIILAWTIAFSSSTALAKDEPPSRNNLPATPAQVAHAPLTTMDAWEVNARGDRARVEVHSMGHVENGKGEVVFRPDGSPGGGTQKFQRGYRDINGKVTWEAKSLAPFDIQHELKTANQKLPAKEAQEFRARLAKFSETYHLPAAQATSAENSHGNSDLVSERTHTAEDKPSRLKDKLEWSRAKAAEVMKILGDFVSGKTPMADSDIPGRGSSPETAPPSSQARAEQGNPNARLLEDIITNTERANDPLNLDGTQNQLDRKKAQEARMEALAAKGKPVAKMASGAVLFYVALGVATAYVMLSDPSGAPVGWQNFSEAAGDPMTWITLAGFTLAAAPFMRNLQGLGFNGKFINQIPKFAAGLLVGTMATTAISHLARDKDFLKCTGLGNYKASGKLFDWNLEACDALYDNWLTTPGLSARLAEIGNIFIPAAASILVGGAAYAGLVQATDSATAFLASRSRVAASIRTVAIAKIPKAGGPLITFGVAALQLGALMIASDVADTTMGITKKWKEFEVTTWKLEQEHMLYPLLLAPPPFNMGPLNMLIRNSKDTGPQPARYLTDAENQLLKEWTRVKKNSWKDPQNWKNTCYDPNRRYSVFFNCDEPDTLDFEGVLDRYATLQTQWRSVQMEDTADSYVQWLKKTNNYMLNINMAYQFYKEILARIRMAPPQNYYPYDGPIITKQPFTYDALQITQNSKYGFRWPWSEDHSGVWKFVDTPKIQDFLLTSMACGPEAEGQGSKGFTDSLQHYWSSWVTGNNGQRDIIKNQQGWELEFRPPRITEPLRGSNYSVCEYPKGRAKIFGYEVPQTMDVVTALAPPLHRYSPATFPVVGMTENGKNYRGLIDYIRENIRTSVWDKEDNEDNFDKWWQQWVGRHVVDIGPQIRNDYKKMLKERLIPALTSPDYTCDKSPENKSGLEKYLVQLPSRHDICGPEFMHRNARGILHSLRDEMRVYLAMMMDLYQNNSTSFNGKTDLNKKSNPVTPLAKELLERFDVMLDLLRTPDAKFSEVQAALKEADGSWDDIEALVSAQPKVAAPRTQRQKVPVKDNTAHYPEIPFQPPPPADPTDPNFDHPLPSNNELEARKHLINSKGQAFNKMHELEIQQAHSEAYQVRWANLLLDRMSDLLEQYKKLFEVAASFETKLGK